MMESSKRVLGTSSLAKPNFEHFANYSDLFLDSQQYSNNGPCVQLLEERLAKFHECKFCVTFANGFWALVMTIESLKLKNKTEILIPSLTYRRMADLVSWTGLTPVYYDVDPHTLTSNSTLIEEKISGKTSIVLGVHPVVNCFPTQEIKILCEKFHLPFVMDSVESAYEINNGVRVGSQALAEVFSMHASKLLNGGEGGYVTTNDENLYELLSVIRGFGFKGAENLYHENGVNSKLNEIHAALALANLDTLGELVEHNQIIYQRYQDVLKNISGIDLIEFNENERTSYKNIVARIDDKFPFTRDELVSILNKKSILARAYYSPPLHVKENKTCYLPNTESCSINHIILPSGYQINIEDVDYVCETIRNMISI